MIRRWTLPLTGGTFRQYLETEGFLTLWVIQDHYPLVSRKRAAAARFDPARSDIQQLSHPAFAPFIASGERSPGIQPKLKVQLDRGPMMRRGKPGKGIGPKQRVQHGPRGKNLL